MKRRPADGVTKRLSMFFRRPGCEPGAHKTQKRGAMSPAPDRSRHCPSFWPARLAVGLELEVFFVCATHTANDSPLYNGSPVLRSRAWAIRNFGRHSVIKPCDVTPRHTRKQQRVSRKRRKDAKLRTGLLILMNELMFADFASLRPCGKLLIHRRAR